MKYLMLACIFILGMMSCTPETVTPDNTPSIECADDNRVQIGNDFQFIEPYEARCYASGDSDQNFSTYVTFDANTFPQVRLWRMLLTTADMEDGDYNIIVNLSSSANGVLPDGTARLIINTKNLNEDSENWLAQGGTLSISQTNQGNTTKCFENVIFLNLVTEETIILSSTIICE